MTLHRQNSRKWKKQRGAAMVEFALVTPIFVTLLLWSMFFTELVRARLRMHEAARFITWELTSYPITDWDTPEQPNQNSNHDAYFNDAKNEITPLAETRFMDLDSVDQRPGLASMAMTSSNFKITKLENLEVDPVDAPTNSSGGGIFAAVTNFVSGGLNFVLGAWNFNTKGKASVEVSVDVQNAILKNSFLDSGRTDFKGGNTRLNNFTLKAKHVMIVNGWHLRDGTDALMGKDQGNGAGERAGGRDEDGKPHSLKRQVAQMTFAGLAGAVAGPFQRIIQVASAILPIPNPFGTYVVSYNFNPSAEQNIIDNGNDQKGCTVADNPGNTASGGTAGYINLQEAVGLDHPTLRCFNTAPFRDTFAYNGGQSLYREMFNARGEYFMGCKNAQADDPTTDADPNRQDRQTQKVPCGP